MNIGLLLLVVPNSIITLRINFHHCYLLLHILASHTFTEPNALYIIRLGEARDFWQSKCFASLNELCPWASARVVLLLSFFQKIEKYTHLGQSVG